ncbi:FtsX-like permease family protein [Helicobacter sp. 10-6591]|uniref:FtsX-like permease family protein n=1 Tax=Helicobacter sp. 10-6591 TaxID=2004998 RepID=UPI000DCEE0F0|nr:FtsX-like permease family protein [Helicobacter sp. 10-6591]RAX54594.1 cell division protein FtsX [Helicobacter sp. 10-6591]
MNSLKRHLALIIPLLALLFGLESILLVNRAISIHEQKLTENYSIVIASKEELSLPKVQSFIPEASELRVIPTDRLTNDLKKDISKSALDSLQKELPYFYSLKLLDFPNQKRLDKINAALLKINGVTKVESFAKAHSQVYKLLLIIKGSVVIFSVLSAVLSCLLMVKQIEVWKFEHIERMQIMSFLGAPSWMRNSILFKLAIIDSLIATIIGTVVLVYFKDSQLASSIAQTLEVNLNIIKVWGDSLVLLFLSIIISLVSVFFVIIKQKDL